MCEFCSDISYFCLFISSTAIHTNNLTGNWFKNAWLCLHVCVWFSYLWQESHTPWLTFLLHTNYCDVMLLLGSNVFVKFILINFNVICTRTSFARQALIHAFSANKLLFVPSLNYACLSFTGQSMEETLHFLVPSLWGNKCECLGRYWLVFFRPQDYGRLKLHNPGPLLWNHRYT